MGEHVCGEVYVYMSFRGFSMVACYVAPSVERDVWEQVIAEVLGFTRDRQEPTLFLGDFNPKSAVWSGAKMRGVSILPSGSSVWIR